MSSVSFFLDLASVGLLLFALQTASFNLLGGMLWSEADFEEEEEDQDYAEKADVAEAKQEAEAEAEDANP